MSQDIAMIRTVSPSTNKVICEKKSHTLKEAREIVAASTTAFATWKRLSFVHRRGIVEQGLANLQRRKAELAHELTLQMGRPIAYTPKEIETVQKRADYLLDIADEALADIPGRVEQGFRRYVRKEPVGPVLVVFAWNFPYLIAISGLVPALLAGNTVILKPSPQTPWVADRILECFLDAGLPPNVLQVIHSGDMQVLKELSQMPEIGLVSFTGSTANGLALRDWTSNRILPLNLELGGNDPAYVRQDADLKYAAGQIVDGAVFNSGQSCCAVERVYVHEAVYEAFIKEVQAELSSYKLGDPLDTATNIGPVISRAALKSINRHIEEALAGGAVDATPPNPTFQKVPEDGNYVAPRLLTNINHDMLVVKEETFGPVIPVTKVAGDDEAVRLMNDSDYGLTASVWTADISRGEELIRELEAGTVFVNRCDYPNPDLAWTGWKNSGLGCTLGPRGFDAFFKLKSYHVKENQS